jgi:hypothetical protein
MSTVVRGAALGSSSEQQEAKERNDCGRERFQNNTHRSHAILEMLIQN